MHPIACICFDYFLEGGDFLKGTARFSGMEEIFTRFVFFLSELFIDSTTDQKMMQNLVYFRVALRKNSLLFFVKIFCLLFSTSFFVQRDCRMPICTKDAALSSPCSFPVFFGPFFEPE